MYQERVIERFLGDLYHSFTSKVNSTQFGWCGNRARKYGLLLHKSIVQAKFSSLDNVLQLFSRSRAVGYLVALVVPEVVTGLIVHLCIMDLFIKFINHSDSQDQDQD